MRTSSLALVLLLAGGAIAGERPLTAIVFAGGAISVRDGETEVAAVAPSCFLQGWRHRGLAEGKPAKDAPGTAELDLEGVPCTVRTSVTPAERSLTIRYEVAPAATLTVESVHVSVSLPAPLWAGSRFGFGEETGTLPLDHDVLHLATGEVSRLKIGPSGAPADLEMVVESASPRESLLQDSRRWGPAFDLRIGELHAGPWGPANPFELEFDLAFNRSLELVYDKPVILKADKDWYPLRGNLDIAAGSALDFSAITLTRSPAGALGWLRAADGKLEFEKERGRPVRFFGVNFCFGALFPAHEEADALAERLQRLGFNTMRIHHYESMGWSDPPGLVDPGAADSLTFHPESLDRLDYFFAALKKRGVYMTTDLYVNRSVKASEIFAGGEGSVAYGFKHLVHVSDRAFTNMQEFCRRLLTHVNPYTGLAYRDDPALAWIALINEGNLGNGIGGLTEDPREAKLWHAAFDGWKRKNRVKGEWGGTPACKRFLWETHLATQRRLLKFLREDIKVKALLTDLNGWTDELGTQVCRTDFDYVDNHYYWDHPSFLEKSWQLPARGWSGGRSAITAAGGFAGRGLTRLLDRPFTMSEYNFCPPNPYRAEGGPLMAAFAALQGWDVLWRFTYSHGRDNLFEPRPVNFFDNVSDPLRQASEYSTISLFLRGDAATAARTVAITGTEKDYMNDAGRGLGGDIDALGWCVRIGTRVGRAGNDPNALELPIEEGLRAGARKSVVADLRKRGFLPKGNRTDPDAGIYESETGEILLDTKRAILEVATPRTVILAGPPGTKRTLGPLEVGIAGCWAAVSAISVDGKNLEESGRILLTHLTDLENTGMRFRGRDMDILEEWGTTPYLVRAGKAAIRLTRARPRSMEVWRLDLAGNRVKKVDSSARGNAAEFELSTATEPDATLYYELVAR